MMTEVADVNPTVTGMDMKSIRTPRIKRNNYRTARRVPVVMSFRLSVLLCV